MTKEMKEKAVYQPPMVRRVSFFVERGFSESDITVYTPAEPISTDPVNGGDWIDGSDDEFGSIF